MRLSCYIRKIEDFSLRAGKAIGVGVQATIVAMKDTPKKEEKPTEKPDKPEITA